MATLGARMTKPGGSPHLHHQGDAEVDEEVEKEDISEEEANEEERKESKGAQVPCTSHGSVLFIKSGPAWPVLVPNLIGNKR